MKALEPLSMDLKLGSLLYGRQCIALSCTQITNRLTDELLARMQAGSRHLMRAPKQHILFPTPTGDPVDKTNRSRCWPTFTWNETGSCIKKSYCTSSSPSEAETKAPAKGVQGAWTLWSCAWYGYFTVVDEAVWLSWPVINKNSMF